MAVTSPISHAEIDINEQISNQISNSIPDVNISNIDMDTITNARHGHYTKNKHSKYNTTQRIFVNMHS